MKRNDWYDKLQRIIDYVENHLQRKEEPVDHGEIAQIAGCSFDFFQKVFSYMNGISFSDYIRFRKLTLAGYDLKSSNIKVVDLSYKYGYDSPTSFTKAFQQFHGFPPKEARQNGAVLRVYPKMQLTANQQYVWRLEKKPSLHLVGKSTKISRQENHTAIPAFWHACQKSGAFSRMISMDNGIPPGLFGVLNFEDGNPDEIRYAIMVISDSVPDDDGYDEIWIPAATWAVFDCRGPLPQAIQNGWRYLLEEWLIQYPFGHDRCPELEWYSDGNAFDEAYLSQIWIPVLTN